MSFKAFHDDSSLIHAPPYLAFSSDKLESPIRLTAKGSEWVIVAPLQQPRRARHEEVAWRTRS